MDLSQWQGARLPRRMMREGRYAALEPLDPGRHGRDLFASARAAGAEERFRFLFDEPPADEDVMARWLTRAADSDDPLFFAVIDRATGARKGGRR